MEISKGPSQLTETNIRVSSLRKTSAVIWVMSSTTNAPGKILIKTGHMAEGDSQLKTKESF